MTGRREEKEGNGGGKERKGRGERDVKREEKRSKKRSKKMRE